MQKQMRFAELLALRDFVRELAGQVDQHIPGNDNSTLPTTAELERAQRENTVGQKTLEAAEQNGRVSAASPAAVFVP